MAVNNIPKMLEAVTDLANSFNQGREALQNNIAKAQENVTPSLNEVAEDAIRIASEEHSVITKSLKDLTSNLPSDVKRAFNGMPSLSNTVHTEPPTSITTKPTNEATTSAAPASSRGR